MRRIPPHLAPLSVMAKLGTNQPDYAKFQALAASYSTMTIKKPGHLAAVAAGIGVEIERVQKLGGRYANTIVEALTSSLEQVRINHKTYLADEQPRSGNGADPSGFKGEQRPAGAHAGGGH